ncbi:hypothetical protein R1flu_012835 [Riccia fluitans]|uniref:F-box domain-containing protein n=1 Tax=Riccia fluitans TaxID=41844 RepID=A0ABD1ZC02_9MARC
MTKASWMNNIEGRLARERLPELPEDLLKEVLIKLPPTDYFNIKCVCKKLCTRKEDDVFRSFWEKKWGGQTSEPEPPFFIFSLGNQEDVTRSPLNQAQSSELPIPPPLRGLMSIRVPGSKWQPFPGSLQNLVEAPQLRLLPSAPGLVLTEDSEPRALWVINPLTRAKREISSELESGYRVRQLVIDDSANAGYFIFAEDVKRTSQEMDLKLLVYDSTKEGWGMRGSLHTLIRDPLTFAGAASLHGTLYCLAITQETAHMYQLDMAGEWRDSDARVPPSLYPQRSQKCWRHARKQDRLSASHIFSGIGMI